MSSHLRAPESGLFYVTGRCAPHNHPGYDFCTDTALTVCYDCVTQPGMRRGIDHLLPGTALICSHRAPDPVGRNIAITLESVRVWPDDPHLEVLHWPAGQCWCLEFHRTQAAALEFDPWRRGMSSYTARPQLLG